MLFNDGDDGDDWDDGDDGEDVFFTKKGTLLARWFDTTAKILRGTATVTLPSIEKNF